MKINTTQSVDCTLDQVRVNTKRDGERTFRVTTLEGATLVLDEDEAAKLLVALETAYHEDRGGSI